MKKKIVHIKKSGPAFYTPETLNDICFNPDGTLGLTAFDAVPSQETILKDMLRAGCTVN